MLKLKSTLLFAFMAALLAILTINTAGADGLKDFILSQLDGKGFVDEINLQKRTIIVDDRLYYLSKNVNVIDVRRKANVNVRNVQVRNKIGFKTKKLKKPTAPYEQLITKIWLLPKGER